MKTLLEAAALLVIVGIFSGCATEGPRLWSPEVHEASKNRIVAEYEADEQYHKERKKSYKAGDGTVTSTRRLRAPAKYYDVALINRRLNKSVTFHVAGSNSAYHDVPPGSVKVVKLPRGKYWVEVYIRDSFNPYRESWCIVDREEDDVVVNGVVYDAFFVAP